MLGMWKWTGSKKVLKIYLVDLFEISECSLSKADSSKILLFSVPPLVATKSWPSSIIFDFWIFLFSVSFHSVFCKTVTNHAARYSSFWSCASDWSVWLETQSSKHFSNRSNDLSSWMVGFSYNQNSSKLTLVQSWIRFTQNTAVEGFWSKSSSETDTDLTAVSNKTERIFDFVWFDIFKWIKRATNWFAWAVGNSNEPKCSAFAITLRIVPVRVAILPMKWFVLTSVKRIRWS